MDSKEVLNMMEALSIQRGIKKESVAKALEESIAYAVGRQINLPYGGEEGIVKVNINRNTGYFEILKIKPKAGVVVDENVAINDLSGKDLEVEELPNIVFDRVAIQSAKQLIMQKVREAERHQLVEDYHPFLNKLVNGRVKRITRAKDIIVFLNYRVEAILPFSNTLPQDNYEEDDEVSAVLVEIDPTKVTHQLFLSRTTEDMVRGLFIREVPEISQQIVEISAIARLPGVRSKVAIRPKDHRVDAMSACIGIQGKRVQAVQKELHGEKIDILEWDDNPEQLVKNVLANANISSVDINPDSHIIDVAVPSRHIGEILGKNGQNIRLATLLIGWDINILEEKDALQKRNKAIDELKQSFIETLDADEELVNDLIQGGFSSIKQIAYAPTEKFLRLKGFDEDLADELRTRAREYLLSNALGDKNTPADESSNELMEMEHMNLELAKSLNALDITTTAELSEYSVDELGEMLAEVDKDLLADLLEEAKQKTNIH